MKHLPNLFGAALLASLTLTLGCPGGSEGTGVEPDARPDVSEPDDEPSVGPDGGSDAELAGETCDAATAIEAGSHTFSNEGASDALQGGCDEFSDGPGGDVVLSFTLDAASGVNINLDADFDPILYLHNGVSCTDEVGCTDAVGLTEALSIPSLDAGTYFIVVDTFIGQLDEEGNRQDDGGTFTVDLELVEPFCEADQFDTDPAANNNTAAGAIFAGQANIDTADLDADPATDDGIALNICPDDVDYFGVFHLGGDLNVTADGVTVELFEATAAVNDETGGIDFTEGSAATAGALPRGAYLIKISGADTPSTGTAYSFAVTHGCEGDASDAYLDGEDDDVADRASQFANNVTGAEHAMCDGDTDAFLLQNLLGGTVTLTANGAAGFAATVSSVVENAEGELVATELTEGFTAADDNGNLVVTLTDAAAGQFLVTLASGTTTGNVDYTVDVAFDALANPPANDTCGAAAGLTLEAMPMAVTGQNLSATHTLAGPTVTVGEDDMGNPVTQACNGDSEVIAETETGPASEVFYHLSHDGAEPLDVQIDVDGSDTDFNNAVYVLQFTDAMCPADLSTLPAVTKTVGEEEVPVCEVAVTNRVRLPQLAAGDYLVVVDGVYSPPFEFLGFQIPESKSEGVFSITATSFPEGFPPPQACAEATAADVPAAGATTTLTVDYTDAGTELKGGCGGNGPERAYTLSPSEDVTLDITAGGEMQPDTVIYVFEGTCGEDAALTATSDNGMCNDDGGEFSASYGSFLNVSLTGGTEYYLVVDAYGADAADSGTATVTIARP